MSGRTPTPSNPENPTQRPARRRGRPRKAKPEAAEPAEISGVNANSPDFLPDGKISDTGPPPASGGDPDADLIQETLRQIMRDTAAPAAAKAQAARTLAEIRQLLGRDRVSLPGVGGARQVRDMTADELAAELAALGGPG